ncbi:MAG: hypothetical protein KDC66_17745, partial [Phaeodactylibacter sp.]|nr:hypothetical protein [Phaeodactylibacter sp.]
MKPITLITLLTLFLAITANAQQIRHAPERNCATQLSPEAANLYMQRTEPRFQDFLRQHPNGYTPGRVALLQVPVQVHIVRRSDGTGGIDETTVWNEFENWVKPYYTASNLDFVFCNATDFINSDTYYNISGDAEGDAMSAAYNVANVLNIYFVNDPDGACGWARFTGDLPVDYIVIANGCADNQSTVAHEIGHYFDLFHTHETAFGVECPDGSNCGSAGDLLCDTPADPDVSGNVDNSCNYTGNATACGGQAYNPDPTNIMSYSLKACRTFFSPQQVSKIAFTSLTGRSYLDYNCTPVNDVCSGAFPLVCGQSVSVDISSATATDNPNTFCGTSSNGTEAGVWYTIEGTGDVFTVSTCNAGTDYDSKLQVFSGSCGSLSCVTGNDDFSDCGLSAQVEFCTEVGVDYYIYLYGFAGNVGRAELSVSCATFPAPWESANIGSVGTGNAYDYTCDERYYISAGSVNNSSSSDNLASILQQFCGDFELTVEVESITSNGFAGLVARESTASGSKMVGLYSNRTNIVRWESRTATNGAKNINFYQKPLPYWLRLTRQGSWIYGYYSYNGVNFSFVSAQYVPMSNCLDIGMAAFSNIPGVKASAVFHNVSVNGGGAPLVVLPQNTVDPSEVGKTGPSIRLFPNPARDVVTLTRASELLLGEDFNSYSNQKVGGTVLLRLRNELGQLIETRQLDGPIERLEWDVSNLNPGL